MSTENHLTLMKFGTQQQIWNSLLVTRTTKYDFFLISKWLTAAILKIIFGHNSAADWAVSVKFCVVKQFFIELR